MSRRSPSRAIATATAFVGVLLAAEPVLAQDPPLTLDDAFELSEIPEDLPSGFGDDPLAWEAYRAARDRKNIRARELAEEILAGDPESVEGHCMLGHVLHQAEGNLPLALFHLNRCRDLFERRWGADPGDDTPWFWHAKSIRDAAFVNGEMGRHQEKVDLLLAHDALYSPPTAAMRGWPLMRLRRYEEARRAVTEAIDLGDRQQLAIAFTALCAIEAEQQKREEGYEACQAAARWEREEGYGGPTAFSNAAEAALGMLKIDEAERLLLEATGKFEAGTVSNPWLDLMHLYLAQGRASESLDALRRMFKWRNSQPAYMDEQNRAETEMASAIFLIVAGHPAEAARITTRALERPDRTGFISSEEEQAEAAAALVDTLAHRTAAELASERASFAPFFAGLGERFTARRLRTRAWTSGRRAAALLADQRILLATLRPYLAGSVETVEWVEHELTALLGAGVVGVALDQARALETLALATGYFDAYEAEIAFLQGRDEDALAETEQALELLPGAEVLLKARVAVIGAQAAERRGQHTKAVELFDLAMQHDPGAVRRQGAALPTIFEGSPGPVAEAATPLLRRSPRFTENASGFRLQITGLMDEGTACLLAPQGVRLACASVTRRAGEDSTDVARRLAAEVHRVTFAPRLDLTQADIRSLDGSPTAGGGRNSDRLRLVLSDLIGDT